MRNATQIKKQVGTALSLIVLAAALGLTTGTGEAGAEQRFDQERPYCVVVYYNCDTKEPTGLRRFDFCDGTVQYVGNGYRTECQAEKWQGDCL